MDALWMSDEQLALWRHLVESRLGMVLPSAQDLIQTRVTERMQRVKLDADSYYRLVQRDPHEWAQLADALTVNETRFFRDWSAMQLAQQYLKDGAHVLSVGCSTGEELWSLAMLALEREQRHCWFYGMDISASALETARHAVYPQRRLIGIPKDYLERYGDWMVTDHWRIKPHLRSRAKFEQVNLLELSGRKLPFFNLIYCQNVLIYFKRFTRRDILQTLTQHLLPGGALILAPGEMTDWQHPALIRLNAAGTLAYEHR